MNQVSLRLQQILEDISLLFCNCLFTAPIGAIGTGVVQYKPAQIQIAPRILHRHSKTILNHLHKYGITFAFYQMQKFKKSAAGNSSKRGYLSRVPITIYYFKLFQIILTDRSR